MWLYTRRTNRFDTGRVNFWELDREIAKLAANAEVVHPELNRGINPDLIARNQRLMEALRQDILIMSTNAQPNAFVGFLRRNRISTLIMSGFPPMSLDMYEKLSKSIKTFKLIALCPGTADSAFKNIRGSVRKEIVPNRPFAVPARVTADDLWSLSVRVRTATNGAVMITRPFIERMLDRNETVALVDAKKVLTSARNRVKKRRRSMSVGTISI
jgi:hypothetical protein